MGFVGVYTAVYDYQPQADGELEIHENDLLYILDKDDDDWWKAKKKAADPEDEEPVGLVPNNYVQEVRGYLSVRSTALSPRLPFDDLSMFWHVKCAKDYKRIMGFRNPRQLTLYEYCLPVLTLP